MPAPDFEWDFPYRSRRSPVFADNIVSTSHPLAAQAGLDVMRRGGNAIDAAIATAAALTVVEPTSNGIGSDAFALIWSGGGLHGLNASGRAPALMTPDRYAGLKSIPFVGWGGVTVPGAVSGWVEASRKFGALPFSELLEPAIRLARDGCIVPPEVARYWALGARGATNPEIHPAWRATFLREGRPPSVGERFAMPDHARTLEVIAATEGEAFYRGALADEIDAASRAADGALRRSDLDAHAADWVRPISTTMVGYHVHQIPPNGQGLVGLMAIGIAERLGLDRLAADDPELVHAHIEAMKLAFADGHRYIADEAHMPVRAEELLSPGYLASRAALVQPGRAQDFAHGSPKPGGTVLLCTADAAGNMVSWIQSNYTGFGSGVVAPGTGVALHNRGCCFTLEPGHPNEVGPGKRPYHTIIPGFVTRTDAGRDEPVMAYGVMGGFMQPQGHMQVLSRMLKHRQNPQAALDAPRWQVGEGLSVTIEPRYDTSVLESLRAWGHDLRETAVGASFGRGQAICRMESGYCAGSDHRADGQAVGF